MYLLIMTIIDRRYGKNLFESVIINVLGITISLMVLASFIVLAPLVFIIKRYDKKGRFIEIVDCRSANEVNKELTKKLLDS